MRQAGHPGKALGLVAAQLGHQAGGQLGLQRGGFLQLGQTLGPGLVGLYGGAFQRLLKEGRGRRGQAQAVLVGARHGLQVGQVRAQPLGQRQVLALAQCHEAALAGLLQQLHQPLQAEHPRVVNLHLAIHREPVTPARQRHLHALRGHRGHAYGLAAWPVQAGHGRQPWQHLQRVQGLFGIVQQPGGITFVGIGQEGQGLEHLCQVRLLGVQGALGGELQTLVHGEQPRTSVPWLHHRPEAPERPRQQAQLQRVTPGHQLSDQACIARHALARCCVAVQLEVAR